MHKAAVLIVLVGIVACRPGDLLRDATDEHGMTGLMRAAAAGDAAEVERLAERGARLLEETRAALEAGANPNASALFGGPVLLDAIRTEPPEAVRLLLEAGARHPRGHLGYSGLHLAVSQRQFDVAEILLEFGVHSIEVGLVTGAAAAGATSWVARFVDAGNDPREENGTPLRAAARSGAVEVVRQFLALGVDPDAPDAYDRIPLGQAVAFGHVETVRILLEGGRG